MNKSLFAIMGVLALLYGCQDTRRMMLDEGYPSEFVDGYQAGCASGRSAAGEMARYQKALDRYDLESRYRQGWDDGYWQCFQAAKHGNRNDTDQRFWQRDRDWRNHVDQERARILSK